MATKNEQVTLSSLDKKLDRVIDVLLTKADTVRVDEFEAKVDLKFQEVLAGIDNLAKVIGDLTLEYAAVKTQLARHEEWIKLIAKKSGVKLPQNI